jgi:outer membrane protein
LKKRNNNRSNTKHYDMKTKILLLLIIGIGIFRPTGLFAQEKMELSLDGAISFALEHNRLIKNASLSMEESQAALRATIAQGLPQVDATLDYQNFFNAQAYLGPMTFSFNPTSNLNLSVGQLIFSGSYIVGIQMQKLYQEMTEINYQKTDADIRAQVVTSYYLVLVSQRTLEILEQNVINISDVIQKTEALVLVGILDETDFDQILLQKTNLENAVRSAQRQLELARNLLRLQLGVSAQTEIILTDQLFSLLAILNPEKTSQTTYDLNQNLDFQLMMIQRDMAKQKLNLEKVKFLPTVAGFYNHTEKIKKPELDFSPKNVIGFNVSIPIFSSGARYFSHTQAKIQYEMAQNQLDLVSEQLSIQESQLRQNLKTAIEQYQVQKETIELARRVYDNTYRKYQQGVISGLDLTTANTNLLQAENGYLMAIMQLIDAKTSLDKFLNQLTQNN